VTSRLGTGKSQIFSYSVGIVVQHRKNIVFLMNIRQGLRLHSPPWCFLKFLYDMLCLLEVQKMTVTPVKKLRNFPFRHIFGLVLLTII
jgi:hypothetical protein